MGEYIDFPADLMEAEFNNLTNSKNISKWKKGEVVVRWTTNKYYKIISNNYSQSYLRVIEIDEDGNPLKFNNELNIPKETKVWD